MLSKSSKWELGFVHFITKFTISRFIISRFECTCKRDASNFYLIPKQKAKQSLFLVQLASPAKTVTTLAYNTVCSFEFYRIAHF